MKKYTVTIQYEQNQRDDYGFPIFGSTTIDIQAVNIEYVNHYLKKLYNNNYNITDITESSIRN